MSDLGEKIQLLQRIDRWAGVPACWLATLLRRCVDATRGPATREPPRSIVFIKLAEQGSTVLAFDALQRAVARVGANHVYFLVFRHSRPIVDLLALLPRENVLEVKTQSLLAMAASGCREVRRLRRLRVDACVDWGYFSRFSALLAWLTGAQMRVGYHAFFEDGPFRGDLMTHRLAYNAHLHAARAFSVSVMALEHSPEKLPTLPLAPPEPAIAEFCLAVGERNEATALLGSLGIRGGCR